MKGKKKLFICDPEKNTSCKKNNCYIHNGQCNKTDKEEFSRKSIKEDLIKDKEYGTMKLIGYLNDNESVYAKVVKQYSNRIILDYSKLRIFEKGDKNLPMHIVDRLK